MEAREKRWHSDSFEMEEMEFKDTYQSHDFILLSKGRNGVMVGEWSELKQGWRLKTEKMVWNSYYVTIIGTPEEMNGRVSEQQRGSKWGFRMMFSWWDQLVALCHWTRSHVDQGARQRLKDTKEGDNMKYEVSYCIRPCF